MATFQKITRANLKTLKPGEKVTERGVTFKRTRDGDGVYGVEFMVDGQRIHRTVGRESDGTTRTHVEIFIEKTRSAAREDRLALPKGRKTALTFKDAAAKYVAILRESGGKCVDRKERQLQLHLNSFFGMMPLSKVSTLDIARYGSQRRARGSAPATVNRELAVVSHLFSKAGHPH